MSHPLLKNINRLHTTALGGPRIRRNLSLDTDGVVEWCKEQIASPGAVIAQSGKNWYVRAGGCVITVNRSSFTLITAHRNTAAADCPGKRNL